MPFALFTTSYGSTSPDFCHEALTFVNLTPRVSARKTLRLVNADCLAAFGASPPFLFVSDELSYAEVPYPLKIVYHAHAVLGPVALVQVVQSGTRKAGTTEAILVSTLHYVFAVLDSALDAVS